jgi:ABC-type bacteriocin/lantibiotic exporter with double-glycine peptidase domain
MVSYVTQEVFLFAGTFEENLRYGNHGFDLSEENMIKCLKKVNAYDFVMNKGGLKGRVEEKGGNLSGGEKQRIILARALIKDPRLLLLDEATSGIDQDSESQIISNLKQLKGSSTIIIITHKLEPFKHIIDQTIYLKKL